MSQANQIRTIEEEINENIEAMKKLLTVAKYDKYGNTYYEPANRNKAKYEKLQQRNDGLLRSLDALYRI